MPPSDSTGVSLSSLNQQSTDPEPLSSFQESLEIVASGMLEGERFDWSSRWVRAVRASLPRVVLEVTTSNAGEDQRMEVFVQAEGQYLAQLSSGGPCSWIPPEAGRASVIPLVVFLPDLDRTRKVGAGPHGEAEADQYVLDPAGDGLTGDLWVDPGAGHLVRARIVQQGTLSGLRFRGQRQAEWSYEFMPNLEVRTIPSLPSVRCSWVG